MKSKRNSIILIFLAVLLLVQVVWLRSREDKSQEEIIGGADGPTAVYVADEKGESEMEFKQITMDMAKEIFQTKGDYLIVDVRRADEFAEGHIPGAINIANESIVDKEPAELPDKDKVIYVYCRSGNRSKQAAGKLAAMGYSNIIEFGGILDWTGEIER